MCNNKHVGFQIRIVSNLIRREIDNLITDKFNTNITRIQGWIIDYINRNKDKDIFQKDIEEEFSIRRSTATIILKSMEKNNLITRNSVSYDARLRKIELTEKAIDINKNFRNIIDEFEEKIIQGLSKEELDTFFDILEKIKMNLE